MTIKSSHHVWEKNIYMIMCWTTPKCPSFLPSNPVILCCLLIIEKAGTHFHRNIWSNLHIFTGKRKEKQLSRPQKTCQCLHKLYTFIQDFTCLHTLHCEKKCDKMYFWQNIWDDVSVVLIWKNLKLWYDKPDYIIEQVCIVDRKSRKDLRR